jgi:hypothetical protein
MSNRASHGRGIARDVEGSGTCNGTDERVRFAPIEVGSMVVVWCDVVGGESGDWIGLGEGDGGPRALTVLSRLGAMVVHPICMMKVELKETGRGV